MLIVILGISVYAFNGNFKQMETESWIIPEANCN